MKRYSLIGLLTLLVAVTVWAAIIEVPEAPARMTAVVVGGGGGGAGSCTTANDADLYATLSVMNDAWGNSDDTQSAEGNVDSRHATKVTTTANTTVTGYRIQGYVSDDSGTITYTCQLRIHDSGADAPEGGSVEGTDYVTGSMATLSIADSWSTSAAERTIDLPSPISLPTGTYWLSCGPTVLSGDYPLWKIDNTGITGRTCLSSDASSTHTYGSCGDNRVYRAKIFGCSP